MVSVYYETKINQCEISGSHSSDAEDSDQIFDALSLGEQFPVFLSSFMNYVYSDAEMCPIRPVSSVMNH
jgi:hypothetical protein